MENLEKLNLTPTMFKHANGFLDLLKSNQFTKVNGFTKISTEILQKHFRSNKTMHGVIKILKDNGIIEVDDHYSIKNKVPKGYRVKGESGIGIEPPIVLESEFFMLPILEGKEYTFSYKGVREVTVVVTKEDKKFALDCCLLLKENRTLHNFEVECIEKDWSKEKMWYLYNKVQDVYLNKKENGLFQ